MCNHRTFVGGSSRRAVGLKTLALALGESNPLKEYMSLDLERTRRTYSSRVANNSQRETLCRRTKEKQWLPIGYRFELQNSHIHPTKQVKANLVIDFVPR